MPRKYWGDKKVKTLTRIIKKKTLKKTKEKEKIYDLSFFFCLLRGASRGRKLLHTNIERKKNNNNPTPNVICETFALQFSSIN